MVIHPVNTFLSPLFKFMLFSNCIRRLHSKPVSCEEIGFKLTCSKTGNRYIVVIILNIINDKDKLYTAKMFS